MCFYFSLSISASGLGQTHFFHHSYLFLVRNYLNSPLCFENTPALPAPAHLQPCCPLSLGRPLSLSCPSGPSGSPHPCPSPLLTPLFPGFSSHPWTCQVPTGLQATLPWRSSVHPGPSWQRSCLCSLLFSIPPSTPSSGPLLPPVFGSPASLWLPLLVLRP